MLAQNGARGGANRWLGITFRTSGTFVHFGDHGGDGAAYLGDGTPLTLASEDERQAFYRLRRRENREIDFDYPPLAYTISESDRWPPEP